jgi:hypothetical protein
MNEDFQDIQNDLQSHPAVHAWIQLLPKQKLPKRVEIIRETHTSKSSVYRLIEAGHRGSSVIAKRCQTELARLDRTFYEDVLPYIPITSAHYYGYLDEDDYISWLFLGDVGDVRYSPLVEEHLILATQWMAVFHTSTKLVPSTVLLPNRGLRYYHEHLQGARDTIRENLNNPALAPDDLILLRNIISQCNLVETKWKMVTSICDNLPRVLTHGDFKKKNICIRTNFRGTDLVALDWETAGLGIPSVDVAESKIEVDAYWLLVRDFWPNINLQILQQLTEIGKVLRYLAAINWEAQSLAYEWIRDSMINMEVYQTRISDALKKIRLVDRGA